MNAHSGPSGDLDGGIEIRVPVEVAEAGEGDFLVFPTNFPGLDVPFAQPGP